MRYEFTYDDRGQIMENEDLTSWRNATHAFTKHVWWRSQRPDEKGTYYRPLFNIYFLANFQMFHLNPLGWHLLLIIWHVLATLLVYLLARRLLKDEVTALIAALLFGLHPVHIEAVAWISGVTEPMLAVFYLAALLAYLRWRDGAVTGEAAADGRERPQAAKWLALSLAMYALALLSKETALTLPAVLFAYEWLFGERGSRVKTALRRAVPFLVLTLLFMVARTLVLKVLSTVAWQMPFSVTLMTIPSVLWFYIRLLIWPVGLSAFYDTPYVTHPDATFWLTCLALAVIAALLWIWARRSKPVAFALGLLVLPILPVLNLPVFIEKEIAHDRYLYIPSVGFCMLLALALRQWPRGLPRVAALPAVQRLTTIVVVLTLGLLTVMQTTYWMNDLQLFARGVAIAPANDIGMTNYGNELFNRQRVDEAILVFTVVADRNPVYWRANFNLGSCYFRRGDNHQALQCRARADWMEELIYDRLGRPALVQMRLGRFDEAEAMFRQAIAERPEVGEYRYGLGIVLKEKGDLDGALAAFKAAAVNPNPLPAQSQIAELQSRMTGDPSRPAGGVN